MWIRTKVFELQCLFRFIWLTVDKKPWTSMRVIILPMVYKELIIAEPKYCWNFGNRTWASGSKLANSLPIIAALQLSSRNWTVSNLLPLYSCFSTLIFTIAGSNPPTNNFGHPGSNPATASSSYWVYRLRCTMVGVRLWTYSLLITLASITFNVHFHHCKFKSYKASDSYMRVYH